MKLTIEQKEMFEGKRGSGAKQVIQAGDFIRIDADNGVVEVEKNILSNH